MKHHLFSFTHPKFAITHPSGLGLEDPSDITQSNRFHKWRLNWLRQDLDGWESRSRFPGKWKSPNSPLKLGLWAQNELEYVFRSLEALLLKSDLFHFDRFTGSKAGRGVAGRRRGIFEASSSISENKHLDSPKSGPLLNSRVKNELKA